MLPKSGLAIRFELMFTIYKHDKCVEIMILICKDSFLPTFVMSWAPVYQV